MTRGQLCKLLEDEVATYRKTARRSIRRNRHLNGATDGELDGLNRHPGIVDAVLVDFVNWVAVGQGLNLGLRRSRLTRPRT